MAADAPHRVQQWQDVPTRRRQFEGIPDGEYPNPRPLLHPADERVIKFSQWGQPYVHREVWVQSKSRRMPHSPDPPETHYATLIRAAHDVARDNLVVMSAADFDFREIVCNWHAHLRRLGISNALVLAMDSELHAHLSSRRITSVDNSANLDAWNATCLQRHIQRVRMERQLALIAIVAAGIDVLHTDATVVFTLNVLPMLRAAAGGPHSDAPHASADFLVQREGGPANAYHKIGSCVNTGFVYVRSRPHTRDAMLRFFSDMVRRGLVEFYNRWNNVVDQMGWSFLVADTSDLTDAYRAGRQKMTSQLDNSTTLTSMSRYSLQLAFLPYRDFPRIGDWSQLRATAAIHHLVGDGSLGPQYEKPWGVLPFRGHRQRLDRYDESDFDAYVKVMKDVGLWLVES